jgi:hypothetical protein
MTTVEAVKAALEGIVDPCSAATGVPLSILDMGGDGGIPGSARVDAESDRASVAPPVPAVAVGAVETPRPVDGRFGPCPLAQEVQPATASASISTAAEGLGLSVER